MSKVVLGIDVAKKTLALALLKDDHFSCKTVENSEAGWREILRFLSQKSLEKSEAYMEATGSYSEPVADFLLDHGFDVKVVNPAKIHAFSGVKSSRNKTDKADAKLIAEFGSKFDEPSYRKMPENIKELQGLYRCSVSLKEQAAMCKNHLENRKTMSKSVVDTWKKVLANLNEQIKEVDEKMLAIVAASEDLQVKFTCLQTIPGVAETTAIAILAEIGDINKFLNCRQLAAFMGVTPQHKESGTSVHSETSISKAGDAILRKALYLPAMTAIRCNKTFARFAQKLEARKLKGKQPIVAVMRKMLHAIFAILKNNSKFNEKLLFKWA